MFTSVSDSRAPSAIFCWNFLDRKPGRGPGAKTTSLLVSTTVRPICCAFNPFPGLSGNYHHRFRQLSKVFLVLAESWLTCTGSSSEGKHFGTACTSSKVPRSSMIHAPSRGTSCGGVTATPGWLDGPVLSGCLITRQWRLTAHHSSQQNPWRHSSYTLFHFSLIVSISYWHYFLTMFCTCSLLSISAARSNSFHVPLSCLPKLCRASWRVSPRQPISLCSACSIL